MQNIAQMPAMYKRRTNKAPPRTGRATHPQKAGLEGMGRDEGVQAMPKEGVGESWSNQIMDFTNDSIRFNNEISLCSIASYLT